MRNKRRKTTQDNKLAAAQNGTKHGDGWSSDEFKKLLKAVEACGKRWKAVAAAVGSRTAKQCEDQYRNLKKAKTEIEPETVRPAFWERSLPLPFRRGSPSK